MKADMRDGEGENEWGRKKNKGEDTQIERKMYK